MEYQRQNNGWGTFIEHWWFLIFAVIALAGCQLLTFFTRLTGMPWIWCYAVALVVSVVGVSLIFCAKVPLYQQRRFFTFGSGVLPEGRRPFYRWGYRLVLLAIALLLCLLVSKQ